MQGADQQLPELLSRSFSCYGELYWCTTSPSCVNIILEDMTSYETLPPSHLPQNLSGTSDNPKLNPSSFPSFCAISCQHGQHKLGQQQTDC